MEEEASWSTVGVGGGTGGKEKEGEEGGGQLVLLDH